MELPFPELVYPAAGNIIHSFNKPFLGVGCVSAAGLGTVLSEGSMMDTAPSPRAPVLAGETHTKLSAPVRVPKNPLAVGAELGPDRARSGSRAGTGRSENGLEGTEASGIIMEASLFMI